MDRVTKAGMTVWLFPIALVPLVTRSRCVEAPQKFVIGNNKVEGGGLGRRKAGLKRGSNPVFARRHPTPLAGSQGPLLRKVLAIQSTTYDGGRFSSYYQAMHTTLKDSLFLQCFILRIHSPMFLLSHGNKVQNALSTGGVTICFSLT
jgi:hypothetical protein